MNSKLGRVGAYLRENWVTPTGKRPFVAQLDPNCALFHSGDEGILAIVSQKADYSDLLASVEKEIHVTTLFYGDRETFFRPAYDELVKKQEFVNSVGSLWKYDLQTLEQSLLLHPLEKKVAKSGQICYFHPAPAMTQDVIGSYSLKPFVFDYSRHDLPDSAPTSRVSSRYFTWRDNAGSTQKFVMGSFALENGSFAEKKRKSLELNFG